MKESHTYEIAYRFAPIIAQKIGHDWMTADQVAAFDICGSLDRLSENPEILLQMDKSDRDSIKASIYYSVCETHTHFFVLYAIYHILDWYKHPLPANVFDLVSQNLDRHMHDMEGALFVITKDPSNRLDAVITVAHENFYLFTEPRLPYQKTLTKPAYPDSLKIIRFQETVDGPVWLEEKSKRAILYVESKGHGVHCDYRRWGAGDEVWYYRPEGESEDPRSKTIEEPNELREFKLEDIFCSGGLWDHRHNDRVMRQKKNGRWGFVYKDKKGMLKTGKANPPWSWNDFNDKSPIGEIATDPAQFILRYAQGWGPVSKDYINNPYWGVCRK